MISHPLPTIERLRELVCYDAHTGAFAHKYADGMGASRNTRRAGQPAFVRCHRQGYRTAVVDGRTVFAHRAAWAIVHGCWPDGQIDHINHDPSDNRISNLRVVTKSQNMRNMPKLRNNKSGVTGVWWSKQAARWLAYIRVDRKLCHLGRFHCFGEAVNARRAAEKAHGFHTNHGR